MMSIVIIDQLEQQKNMKTAASIFKYHSEINFLFLNKKGCLLGSDKPVTLPFDGGASKYEQHVFRHFECDHDQSIVKTGEIVSRVEDTKHPHHDIMIALAKNKNLKIETLIHSKWIEVPVPTFDPTGVYRIKPETITVGGFTDYPKPVKPSEVVAGGVYFIAGSFHLELDKTPKGVSKPSLYSLKSNLVFKNIEDCAKATEILTKILTGVTPNA